MNCLCSPGPILLGDQICCHRPLTSECGRCNKDFVIVCIMTQFSQASLFYIVELYFKAKGLVGRPTVRAIEQ